MIDPAAVAVFVGGDADEDWGGAEAASAGLCSGPPKMEFNGVEGAATGSDEVDDDDAGRGCVEVPFDEMRCWFEFEAVDVRGVVDAVVTDVDVDVDEVVLLLLLTAVNCCGRDSEPEEGERGFFLSFVSFVMIIVGRSSDRGRCYWVCV